MISHRWTIAAAVFSATAWPAVPAAAEVKPTAQITVKSFRTFANKVGDLLYSIKLARGDGEEMPRLTVFARGQLAKNGSNATPGFDVDKPFGLRVVYRPPQGRPIDGDLHLLLPTTNGDRLARDLLPTLGAVNLKTDQGVTTFELPGLPMTATARESGGYFFIGLPDAEVVAPAKLPKADDVFRNLNHDVTLTLHPSTIPGETLRDVVVAAGRPGPGEQTVRAWNDSEQVTLGVDVDASAGLVTGEFTYKGKPGSKLASAIETSRPGPLKSAIGIAPDAWFKLSLRGEYVQKSGLFEQLLVGWRRGPLSPANQAMADLIDALTKAGVEDMSLSVSPDGTVLFAIASKAVAGLGSKLDSFTNQFIADLARNNPGQADEVKKQSGKNAATLAGVPLARFWNPKKGMNGKPIVSYVGVKNDVFFFAVTVRESTKNVEAALLQPPAAEAEPLALVVNLKALADTLKLTEFKGTTDLKVESRGTVGRIVAEVPAKDLAVLFKLGLAEKLPTLFMGGND